MASRIDDLLGSVVNRLRSLGIGEKGRFQLEREADPVLEATFRRQEMPVMRRPSRTMLRPPADTSGDVYYGLPERNIVEADYPTYTPTEMPMSPGLLSTPQGLDIIDTVPTVMSQEAVEEYQKGDQTVAGQIELKPEYLDDSRPSNINPQNREFEHPITGISYVILPDGRTYEKDRVQQFTEADSLIMGVSGAPKVAGSPFSFIADSVRTLFSDKPKRPDFEKPTVRPETTLPTKPDFTYEAPYRTRYQVPRLPKMEEEVFPAPVMPDVMKPSQRPVEVTPPGLLSRSALQQPVAPTVTTPAIQPYSPAEYDIPGEIPEQLGIDFTGMTDEQIDEYFDNLLLRNR